MKPKKIEIIYSEPVKEIMGNPPRRILRWGTTVLFLVFVVFILFSWLIRYPDIIPAPIEITTTNPPVTLPSKITGYIKEWNVKERDTVKTGQVLVVMETTADLKEIELLKKTIDTINRPESLLFKKLPEFSELGELQETYASFFKALYDLNNYTENDYYGNKITSLIAEINAIMEYIERLTVKEKLYTLNQKLEEKKFNRNSSLFNDRLIPESEFEVAQQSLNNINISLQQVRLDHSAKSIEIAEKQQLLQDYRIMQIEEKNKLISILRESFLRLKAKIKLWEIDYLLVSPIDGIVTFTRYWIANQSVVKDEPVINVVPLESGNFLGRIKLNMQRSGKVKQKQPVNVKLAGYPYMEYGIVMGEVKNISLVPSDDTYYIEIALTDGLTTIYGNKLEFTQNMQGTAEIITEDIRLLQQIINPFRFLIAKNKRKN